MIMNNWYENNKVKGPSYNIDNFSIDHINIQ